MIRFAIFIISITCALQGRPFVTAHLNGQLGNQMYQIAVATAVALDNDMDVMFPELKTRTEFDIHKNYEHVLSRVCADEYPEPMETVFISWYDGGEVFRSGVTYRRGGGKIFYFSPGHEVYPIYNDENVRTVLRNGVKWAYNPAPALVGISDAPNRPASEALEPIVERGPTLHAPGETGFR